jgi:hypothetical protein
MLQRKILFILKVCLFFACLSLLIMSVEDICADTDISVYQFFKEADAKWKKLTNTYSNGLSMQINYTLPKESSFKANVCLLGKNELVQIYLPTNTVLNVINARYAFSLGKKANVDTWELSKMWDDPKMPRESSQFHHGLLQTTAFVFEPIMIESSWINDLIKSDELEVISLKERRLESENCIELRFRCRQYNVNKHTKLLSGTILFDKEKYFVIKEYNIETEFIADELSPYKGEKNSGSDIVIVKKKLEYQDMDGIPYLKTSRISYKLKSSTLKRKIFDFADNNQVNIDCEIIDSNKVNKEIFFLKHYGFSEPASSRVDKLRMVLIVVGLVLIFLGLTIKFWLKKNSKE